MFHFSVHGPFVIPQSEKRMINPEQVSKFWDDKVVSEYKECRGCYIFARRQKKIVPWYVGKTSNNFYLEAFHSDKLVKYNKAIIEKWSSGTPLMYFVVTDSKFQNITGNEDTFIGQLEKYLIQLAKEVNPDDLINKQNTKEYWTIDGVTGPAKNGRRNKAEISFGEMFWS